MTQNTSLLFKPFVSEKLQLKNRLLMAPMTRTHSPQGIPAQNVVDYYRRRAAGGIGLIITEGTTIDHALASGDPNVPCFHGEKALLGWQKVADAVHQAGGKIAPQLWHLGGMRRAKDSPHPELTSMGPTDIDPIGENKVRPMTQEDIDSAIAAYAQGAADARRLGFDAVEIHGAHGYLLDQFFWKKVNQRSDKYGGPITDRSRFAVEVVRAMRGEVGEDFPIILRFSQFKMVDYEARIADTPQELEQLLTPLADAGVDIFHASQRRFWEAEFPDSTLNLAGWAKKLSGKPAITVGSVGLNIDFISSFAGEDAQDNRLDELLECLQHNEFDLVAVGRALISDPAWAQKIHQQQDNDIIPFNREDLARLT